MTNPDHYITLSSSAGHRVEVLFDVQNSAITGGHGGWSTIPRPKRKAATRFDGSDPYTIDLPIQFNGVRGNVNQETHIAALVRMAEPVGHLKQPPTVLVVGAFPLPNIKWWVIENIQWDNQSVTWQRFGNVVGRTRQSAVVTLLEYVDEQIIVTQPSPAISAGASAAGTKIKTSTGKTVKQEAQIEYGDPSWFTKILEANPWLPIDPRLVIPVGTQFVVPPLKNS